MDRRGAAIALVLLLLSLLLVWQARRPSPVVPGKRAVAARKGWTDLKAPIRVEDTVDASSTFPLLPETEEPKPIIEITSHTGRINAQGYYEVVGELANSGKVPASGITVNVRFKNRRWRVVGEASTAPQKTLLFPGEKTFFRVILADLERSQDVSSFIALITISRQGLEAERKVLAPELRGRDHGITGSFP